MVLIEGVAENGQGEDVGIRVQRRYDRPFFGGDLLVLVVDHRERISVRLGLSGSE